jgi:hypothetical protein
VIALGLSDAPLGRYSECLLSDGDFGTSRLSGRLQQEMSCLHGLGFLRSATVRIACTRYVLLSDITESEQVLDIG